jgi:archaemetzincin
MLAVERIAFVAVGPVPRDWLEQVAAAASEILGVEVMVAEAVLPLPAADRARKQILARAILAQLRALPDPGASRVLGVTEADLYAPGLNFVFGEADLGGRGAVISLARLRPEYYRLEPNPALLLGRAVKEAVHELGHTYGLSHCARPSCVMHFSITLADTDRKGARPCADCQAQGPAPSP